MRSHGAVVAWAWLAVLLACVAQDDFDRYLPQSFWTDAEVSVLSPRDLTPNFEQISPGKTQWSLDAGLYQMPPHVAAVQLAAELRIVGAGVNKTFLQCLGGQNLLVLQLGTKLAFEGLTLTGVVPGFITSAVRREDFVTQGLYPRVYLVNMEWTFASSDLRSAPGGFTVTTMSSVVQYGIFLQINSGDFAAVQSPPVTTATSVTFAGPALFHYDVIQGGNFTSVLQYMTNVTARDSPDTHEMEDLFNKLIATNGPSRPDCYNANASDRGFTYRGVAAVTISGFPCKRWDDLSTAPTVYMPAPNGSFSSTQENYCRNPRFWQGEPWCYTTNPEVDDTLGNFELCNVPACPSDSQEGEAATQTGDHQAAIIGGVVGGAAALAAVAALALLYTSKRRKSSAMHAGPAKHTRSLHAGGEADGGLVHASAWQRVDEVPLGGPSLAVSAAAASSEQKDELSGSKQLPSVHMRTDLLLTATASTGHDSIVGWTGQATCQPGTSAPSLRSTRASTYDPESSAQLGWMPAPVRVHAESFTLAALTSQLDDLHARNAPLCGRFLLAGKVDRRVGGQAVVQFASAAKNSRRKLAVKFYLNAAAFATEEEFLRRDELRPILPAIEDIIGHTKNKRHWVLGRPLPPMVVMERGESLDEWQRRCPADFFQSVTIVIQLAQHAADMHDAGIVHRDLKPANIIWYPARNSWTILDFGIAARIGTTAPLACTVAYAAPEVVQAMARGEREMVADAASDVWALGVIAWELMTRSRVFRSRDQAEAALVSEAPLPWERTGEATTGAAMRQLGFMQGALLRMLARRPEERVGLREALREWRGYLHREATDGGGGATDGHDDGLEHDA